MTDKLAPHVSATDTGTGMVLLDERSGRYWQLNGTGADVVRLLGEGKPPQEIVSAFKERFPDHGDAVAADVDRLLRSLREAGLVRS
ncbi:lasso peptide biosynthesis PqqD family chaperone [Streptomyces albidoflavus]|uniref:lasso peptide biosynthesis PqqD family chaperone n=1 Tax=Streptomyces TaxID=1883 RepID=UPI00063ED00A|nr:MULTISPECIES: lasso peptide biosynthesis PqqD family chaperone [unclassified Streptomyces]KLJ03155.1 hypothetical protein WQ59_09865 [Streptomyces sp. KE1]MCK2141937.1 lasso peptide biosynthesis PqqD family chaperone [Streptomyces sp. WAC00276]